MNIIAFAATNSTRSINKQLAAYAAQKIDGATVEVLDLNDFELPLFSEDKEAELGQPALAQAFLDKISASDGLVISFAEHNGSYTAAYKNLFDWSSRIKRDVYAHKPTVYLAASPGPGGAASVLDAATKSAAFFAADVKASLSIPSFYDNFDVERQKLTNVDLDAALTSALETLKA